MSAKKAVLFATCFALAGCATIAEQPTQVRVTSDEVAAYVRAHWADYERRVVTITPRNGERATLIAVGDSKCEDYYGTARCQIAATIRFGEQTVDHRFWSTFDRKADGSLEEVIILVHERRRR